MTIAYLLAASLWCSRGCVLPVKREMQGNILLFFCAVFSYVPLAHTYGEVKLSPALLIRSAMKIPFAGLQKITV
jgi:hypothetical protein